jgi:hypothetical protein
MKNPLENCPLGLQSPTPGEDHVLSCVEEHRAAAAHLVAHLREALRRRSNYPVFERERRQHPLLLRQLERAHEVSKEADAKFESLISRLASSL